MTCDGQAGGEQNKFMRGDVMLLNKSVALCLCFALLWGIGGSQQVASAQINSLPEAINKAGRQRMLSQRMLKAWLMVGIDVQYEDARRQLKQAMTLYDQQLAELRDYVRNPEVQAALDEVETIWLPLAIELEKPVDRKEAERLIMQSDNLLRASHKVVLMLQDLSGTRQGRLVNIAGRQRMLGQRLAKLYMARMWGFDNALMNDEVQRAQNEFKGALAELMSSELNSIALNTELKKADRQWRLFESALKKRDQPIPLIIAVNSEQLLDTMNQITGMYAALR